MLDIETESLWPQVMGECVNGPSEGKKLTPFPAIHTTYAEFKRLYPDGMLLKKPEKGRAGSMYERYFSDPDKLGMFGRVSNYQRLPGKSKVFGIRIGDRQAAVSLDYLSKHGFVVIESLPDAVIVTYDSGSQTESAFRLGEDIAKALDKIEVNGNRITLSDSQLEWDSRTGRPVEGKGDDLAIVPTMTAYWFAWLTFFPETELVH